MKNCEKALRVDAIIVRKWRFLDWIFYLLLISVRNGLVSFIIIEITWTSLADRYGKLHDDMSI